MGRRAVKGVIARATASTAPEGARELGVGPFLEAGEQIDWHYRHGGWETGDVSNIAPMRVVREDERGLVAWLALGTRLAPSAHRAVGAALERRTHSNR